MDNGMGPQIIWGVTMLVLVGSSLIARRVPVGQFVRYTLIWLVIFAGAYGLVLFRGELGQVWDRAKADLSGGTAPVVTGTATRIRQSDDGHFWVDARINGRTMRFLIDSGATTSILSDAAASELGLADGAKDALPLVVMTANGAINAWPVDVQSINVGTVEMRPLAMMVTDGNGDENILGMNWLNRLGSWKVEGGVMTITP